MEEPEGRDQSLRAPEPQRTAGILEWEKKKTEFRSQETEDGNQ
jgi:hypothetical protein